MRVRLPQVGDQVNLIEKRNYASGRLVTGIVKRTLSDPRRPHPRGNKVELTDGTVGRVVSFVDEVGRQPQVPPLARQKYREEIRHGQNEVRSNSEGLSGQVRAADFLDPDDLR